MGSSLCRQSTSTDGIFEVVACEPGLRKTSHETLSSPISVHQDEHLQLGGATSSSRPATGSATPELRNIAMNLAKDSGSTGTSRSGTPLSTRSRHHFHGHGLNDKSFSETGTSPPNSARSVLSTLSDARAGLLGNTVPDGDVSREAYIPRIIVAEGDWEVHIARTVQKKPPPSETPSTTASTPIPNRGMSAGLSKASQGPKIGGASGQNTILRPGASGSRGVGGNGAVRAGGIGQPSGAGTSVIRRPGTSLSDLASHQGGDTDDDQPISDHGETDADDKDAMLVLATPTSRTSAPPGAPLKSGLNRLSGQHGWPLGADMEFGANRDFPLPKRPTNLFAGISGSTSKSDLRGPKAEKTFPPSDADFIPQFSEGALDRAVDKALSQSGRKHQRGPITGIAAEAQEIDRAVEEVLSRESSIAEIGAVTERLILQLYTGLQTPSEDAKIDKNADARHIAKSQAPSQRVPPRNRAMKRGASGAPIRKCHASRLAGISEEVAGDLEQQSVCK